MKRWNRRVGLEARFARALEVLSRARVAKDSRLFREEEAVVVFAVPILCELGSCGSRRGQVLDEGCAGTGCVDDVADDDEGTVKAVVVCEAPWVPS